jgi:dihydroorotate dehydrogenase electron transfer subunit
MIAPGHFIMEIAFPLNRYHFSPGQFINVKLPAGDHLVPRPFSVLDQSESAIRILYKVFGEGTRILSEIEPQTEVDILFPLGNSFPDIEGPVALLSGGIGVVPLYFFARQYALTKPDAHSNIMAFLGAATSSEVIFQEEFRTLEVPVTPSTDDGSLGMQGTCLDALLSSQWLKKKNLTLLACGPKGLLRAAAQIGLQHQIPVYLAVEEVMGCGFGACVGCVIPVKDADNTAAYKLVCQDGPVFEANEIDWER